MDLDKRARDWAPALNRTFDVAIVGGGINGACLYHHLAERGYSVVILDKGDFASGTSQGSSMMVWGGLLYLRNGDVATVAKLCASRDRMTKEVGESIVPTKFRLVKRADDTRASWFLLLALWIYWILAFFRRDTPKRLKQFPERAFLDQEQVEEALDYDEAYVRPSDARFTLRWLLARRGPDHVPLNHAALEGGAYEQDKREWRLDVKDTLTNRPQQLRARLVVNAAGAWTDKLNAQFGRTSPYKHALSKGVHIGFARDPSHTQHLMLETVSYPGDVFAMCPWGPISLYGPTETVSRDTSDGYRIEPDDVELLIREANRQLEKPIGAKDIVTLRVGLRALACDVNADVSAPQEMSRETLIHSDAQVPWISVYGGKLTGCTIIAHDASEAVAKVLKPSGAGKKVAMPPDPTPELVSYPGLAEQVPSPKYCYERESCWTLEDWLRRRTNVAQWVPRWGLGRNDEHVPHLVEVATTFTNGDRAAAEAMVNAWREKVRREYDAVLDAVAAKEARAEGKAA
jgi:glycerol-3-phosphate dehydrogenase